MSDPAVLLAERTRRLARRRDAQDRAPPGPSMLVCAVGGERIGFPLAAVEAVLPARPVLPAPGAMPAILGILGRAGEVLAVVDTAALLGLPRPADDTPSDRHFLVLAGRGAVVLSVSRALGIAEADNIVLPPNGRADGPVTGLATARAGRLGPTETSFAIVAVDRLMAPLFPAPHGLGAPPEESPP